ncbi:MAG: formate/nitrite transporter family protein [Candidatus Gastranaerophilales bacterium]|nr:formate/nitrite transporter family protein [Candidatus Gastranaerophilales bacterium]
MTAQIADNKDCVSPSEVASSLAKKIMPKKAQYSFLKMFLLAIAAGAFVAFGAHSCLTVMTGTIGVSWGLAKLIGGIVFSTGLMMVVLTGAELFTGNVLMTFSLFEKKISLLELLKSWTVVYFGNFVGAIVIATLVFLTGASHNASDAVGVITLSTATTKVNLSFVQAFTSGILCNWLVCLAVWMAACSRRIIGKIFAIFFPIMIFVASGYEHCVANMFFIPEGIFTKTLPSVVAASNLSSEALANLTWQGFVVNNLIPATLGNIVGVVVFVVLLFWMAYLKDEK